MKQLLAAECQLLSNSAEVLCLDIREFFEYEAVNIGWVNVPMAQVTAYLENEKISKDHEILLLCNTGKRACALANLLSTEAQFLKVYVVEDGLHGWKQWVDPHLVL